MILTLVTYPIVNQTVAQRVVAARSEMDARKGTIASLLPWWIITGVTTMVGIMGVVLLPEVSAEEADFLFPIYMQRYLPTGLLGLGVTALIVASMSTGAGIGTAIAGLMTVDVFKLGRDNGRSDRDDLRMTRLFASASIVCGTLFAMFIPMFGGMIPFYVAMTGTFFLPLTVPYVGGALYRSASRGSGIASLVGGIGLGSVLFLGGELEVLPPVLSHPQWRPFWVLGFSWLTFVGWSLVENRVKGRIPQDDLASVLNAFDLGKPVPSERIREIVRSRSILPWEGQKNVDYDTLGKPKDVPWYGNPATFELSAVVLLVLLMIWWW
jgi:Na+/proline symporter